MRKAALLLGGSTVLLLAAAFSGPGQVFAGAGGPASNFLGAGAGSPIAFDLIKLPAVIVAIGAPAVSFHNNPFAPDFETLVQGETVITTQRQMHYVWSRLFGIPFDPELFDFDNTFVVLMGNGLQHPAYGFEITNVEQFEGSFVSEMNDVYLEHALAVVATEFLPGPPPKPADPIYMVSAVTINKQFLGDILFSRQVFAAP